MADLPDDVMKAAGDAILAGGKAYRVGGDSHLAIAHAILAEREAREKEIHELRALLDKAASKLENCRYSELPLAKELRAALANV